MMWPQSDVHVACGAVVAIIVGAEGRGKASTLLWDSLSAFVSFGGLEMGGA